MKACVDTNVLISHLLGAASGRAPTLVLDYFFEGRFDLIISETTIAELMRKIEDKRYLADRIPIGEAQELVALLRGVATIVEELSDAIPPATRDPKDDYLIAHSIIEQVDYLVSGDKDLLALGSVLGVRILSPADFVLLLRTLED